MNIVWIPHTSRTALGAKSRAQYFIEQLVSRHSIHEVCWDVPVRRSVGGLRSALARWTRAADGVTLHHLPRLPSAPGRLGTPAMAFNQAMFHRLLRTIVRESRADVVIGACNWYAIGFPPTDLPVALVLDYFDFLHDAQEAGYFSRCQAVLCSSSVMYDRARRYSAPCYFLPNGIERERFAGLDGAAAKRRYGLAGSRVVSLIGLTASERLYFIDAIELVSRRFPDVRGVFVGDGPLRSAILAAIRGRERLFSVIEAKPYNEMPALFAATDVGLYPADKAVHFDAALPIKVLEYSAAGKPVVTPPLEELTRLGFANLRFAPPTAEGFADAIGRALHEPVAAPDLERFEIGLLANRLEQILEEVVAAWAAGRRAPAA